MASLKQQLRAQDKKSLKSDVKTSSARAEALEAGVPEEVLKASGAEIQEYVEGLAEAILQEDQEDDPNDEE